MRMKQAVWTLRRVTRIGVDRLHCLVIRFGIASLPADVLLNCDDIVYAALALTS